MRIAPVLVLAVVLAPAVPVLARSAPATAAVCAPLPSDFNGDGYADLAVGEPGSGLRDISDFDGAVRVIPGSPNGLTAAGARVYSNATAGVPAPIGTAPRRFGARLASGFFNGDCHADLAVGDFAGNVLVLYGSATGLTTAGSARYTAANTGGGGAGDGFGMALTVGDFNGDGHDDLAVGSPYANSVRGSVTVLAGSPAGLAGPATRFTLDTAGVPGAATNGDRFGAALAAGDFTGDHKADLAVGVPGAAAGGVSSGGAVVVLPGAAGGLTGAGAASWNLATAGVPGDPAVDDDFGSSLATGDSDRDGRADLAVGAPYKAVAGRPQAGQVTVLRGAPTGLTTTGARAWNQDTAGVPDAAENGDLFGGAAAFGDFNRDGYEDLAIGSPFEGLGAQARTGTVTVLPGSAAGLTTAGATLWHRDAPGVPGSNDNDDYFGGALIPVRSHGGDGLAIGVPEEILASATDNPGSVLFLPGSITGLTTTGSRVWTGAQLPGGLRVGGHFGTALA